MSTTISAVAFARPGEGWRAPSAPRTAVYTLSDWLVARAKAVLERHRMRRNLQVTLELSDELLRDIDMSRSQLEYELRRL